MMASGRAARTSSGVISGSGLAMAKMIGLAAIDFTMSLVTAPLTDRPKKTSAPSIASLSERALVRTACALFHWFMPSVRPCQITPLVSHQDGVLVRQAHRLDQLDAGDRGGARAVHHQLDVLDVAAGEVQRVDQAGRRDDGGAVLVVVEDRDVHQLAQALLDDEAFRRLDVLEVDAAEGRARGSARN